MFQSGLLGAEACQSDAPGPKHTVNGPLGVTTCLSAFLRAKICALNVLSGAKLLLKCPPWCQTWA